ncbi:MAG: Holliday junction branch migration protein RuvA [Deltaproteobacteria bacterium]|nr:Holliday junction branch migration protein RuvA [Deltaproteobacteria bacterium]
MIGALSGTVSDISGNRITLDVQGVGYELCCSRASLEKLVQGEEAALIVFTDVKEDSINLYGFEDRLEKQVFLLLTKVNGVGARTASEIISRMDKLELLRVIGAGDVARLQMVKGIGKKTAERIVVELKDRVAEFAVEKGELQGGLSSSLDQPYEDAIQALVALGFSRKVAEQAVAQARAGLSSEHSDSGKIIKEALRFI